MTPTAIKTDHLNSAIVMKKRCSTRVVIWKADKAALGGAMRRVREDCGVGLRQLAKSIGFSAAYLSDCELGRRELNLENLAKYIEVCQKHRTKE